MLRRFIGLLLGMLALLVSAHPVGALMGTIDVVPAATLLFPYFEVDLDDINGPTTLLAFQNSGAAPALVRVTLWTDAAVPTSAFDVYLTGYDVQAINVRDLFLAGNDALRAAHQGRSSLLFGGECVGFDHGDAIVRGYITIDNISYAPAPDVFPGDPGYFVSGGAGIANNNNVLTGDFMLIDPGNDFAQSDMAVHIEADASYGGNGQYTFYGREVGGTGEDNREPLPNVLGAAFLLGYTEFIAWRDTGIPGQSFVCDTVPIWFPMAHEFTAEFDTESNPQFPGLDGTLPFSFAVTRVLAGGPYYPISVGKAGWVYLNLNENRDIPGAPFGRIRQAWVWAVRQDEGLDRFSHGASGIQLQNPSTASKSRGLVKSARGAR